MKCGRRQSQRHQRTADREGRQRRMDRVVVENEVLQERECLQNRIHIIRRLDAVMIQVQRLNCLKRGIHLPNSNDVLVGQLGSDDGAVKLVVRHFIHSHQLNHLRLRVIVLHRNSLRRTVRALTIALVSIRQRIRFLPLGLDRLRNCFAPLHLGRLYEGAAVGLALKINVYTVFVRQ